MLMISARNTHNSAQLISIIYRVIITDYGAFWQVRTVVEVRTVPENAPEAI